MKEKPKWRPSIGIVPQGMDEASVEAAFQAAGFQMHSKEQLGSNLMRLARMRRKQVRYEKVPGIMRYEVRLANYRWTIYMLLGKLSPTLYVLRKIASS